MLISAKLWSPKWCTVVVVVVFNLNQLILSVVVQSLNRVQLFATAWTAVCQASLAFTISQSLLKLMPIELVSPLSSPSNHLILYHPLLLLPLIFPNIKVFSDELTLCIRWPKYQSFCISPSNEYSGLISFRTDWLALLGVQRTLRLFSSTTIWKHQFFSAHASLWWSNSQIEFSPSRHVESNTVQPLKN